MVVKRRLEPLGCLASGAAVGRQRSVGVDGEQSVDRCVPMFGVLRRMRARRCPTIIGNGSCTLEAAAGGEAACKAERLQCGRDREFKG